MASAHDIGQIEEISEYYQKRGIKQYGPVARARDLACANQMC